MRDEVAPVETEEKWGGSGTRQKFTHDAFGTITMTTVTGGDKSTLFGSDLGHNQCVRISIQRASLSRDLSHDWIHGESRPIVEFEMSHAQFAQFITSQGQGCGTPVTLRYAPEPGTDTETMPGIRKIETKHETFRREIQQSAAEQTAKVSAALADLQAMADNGKINMKEFRAALHTAKCQIGNLPTNLAYTVRSAEEALEKATSDAKIEVEAFVNATAQRLGLSHISQLGQIENKS
jgi:hypothetical protein